MTKQIDNEERNQKMSKIHASTPYPIPCLLRKEYLYNMEEHQGEFCDAQIIGVSSYKGEALTFHVLVENGGLFHYIPAPGIVVNKQSRSLLWMRSAGIARNI